MADEVKVPAEVFVVFTGDWGAGVDVCLTEAFAHVRRRMLDGKYSPAVPHVVRRYRIVEESE